MLAASSPARSGLGEPGGEWEELWILEDRVRGVGASWNRKASARAYFAPDGQSQGELLSLSSQQSRCPSSSQVKLDFRYRRKKRL